MQTKDLLGITKEITKLKDRLKDNVATAKAVPNNLPVAVCATHLESAHSDAARIEAQLNEAHKNCAADPWNALWLAPFGLIIGLLAALSTYDGTTYTLIGLLFAAVGGSLVAWFRETPLPALERRLLVIYVCALSCGLFLGLVIGIGLRAYGPAITTDAASAAEQVEIRKLRKTIVDKLTTEVADGEWNSSSWPRTELVLKYLESSALPPAGTAVGVKKSAADNPFLLHRAAKSELLTISQRLVGIKKELVKVKDTPQNVLDALDQQIKDLETLANKAEQSGP